MRLSEEEKQLIHLKNKEMKEYNENRYQSILNSLKVANESKLSISSIVLSMLSELDYDAEKRGTKEIHLKKLKNIKERNT